MKFASDSPQFSYIELTLFRRRVQRKKTGANPAVAAGPGSQLWSSYCMKET
ncbi:hypothetical protein LEP1GSC186_2784 [Leptospira noguchii serovar Autumnalis str. ZUN142]|uniref:Uncharacterized protein n=1 Tax=Leptospira noguchii serovar Autumnalis str. ZUN142 TaxID=1085540 RepID=M6UDM6_9LEPT|nr:hypothetical protein LEP1GSC186_2784 [Leptospira noguchii serovar Autumnalis str. ZUN142]